MLIGRLFFIIVPQLFLHDIHIALIHERAVTITRALIIRIKSSCDTLYDALGFNHVTYRHITRKELRERDETNKSKTAEGFNEPLMYKRYIYAARFKSIKKNYEYIKLIYNYI